MSKRGRTGFLSRKIRESRGPADPKAGLTAIAATTFSWDLATDALTWGSNAAEVLGIPHIGLFPTGAAFTDAVEPGSGICRPDAIQAAEAIDEGSGVPYAARYALRTRADRLVHVEETGRWYGDDAGRPALVHGVLRVSAHSARPESFGAGLKARAALLAQIVDDVVEAQRSSHTMTLVVGAYPIEDQDPEAAIAEIARRIRPLLRRRDRFAAYGPNRFALALASCPGSEAQAALRRVFALVEGHESGSASVATTL